jgi:hypothetical protein
LSRRVAVVGAGFFGGMIALILARRGYLVDLYDREVEVMAGASRYNHNRLHRGYHYLRSIKTSRASLQGLSSFREVFGESILSNFPNYYAISTEQSKTNPDQFEAFCDVVQIPYQKTYPERHFLNREKITACYRVPEPVYDHPTAATILFSLLRDAPLTLRFGSIVDAVRREDTGFSIRADRVWRNYDVLINATYAELNTLNEGLGLSSRSYLYEDVSIPVFRYNSSPFGITVMDGEFCSVVPRGRRSGEFLLYHVRASVLRRHVGKVNFTTQVPFNNETTIFSESETYMPFLSGLNSFECYRSIRIVWENSDDARHTTLYNDLPNYYSILSGKVTTCIDLAQELADRLEE